MLELNLAPVRGLKCSLTGEMVEGQRSGKGKYVWKPYKKEGAPPFGGGEFTGQYLDHKKTGQGSAVYIEKKRKEEFRGKFDGAHQSLHAVSHILSTRTCKCGLSAPPASPHVVRTSRRASRSACRCARVVVRSAGATSPRLAMAAVHALSRGSARRRPAKRGYQRKVPPARPTDH